MGQLMAHHIQRQRQWRELNAITVAVNHLLVSGRPVCIIIILPKVNRRNQSCPQTIVTVPSECVAVVVIHYFGMFVCRLCNHIRRRLIVRKQQPGFQVSRIFG